MILLTLEPALGNIARYVAPSPPYRFIKTHEATFGSPVTFGNEIVEEMREHPPETFRINAPPPKNPPPSGTPLIQRAA